MDIECKLKREGGTHVDIDRVAYHFAPREDGAHVATVTIEAHQERFLSITDAYRLYRGQAAAPAPVAAPVAPVPVQPEIDLSPTTLLGASGYLDGYEINGKAYTFAEILELARAGSGLDAQEWNELEEESRADLIDEQLDKLAADTNGDGTVDQSEERAALAAEYRAKFGKAPASRLSVSKIREALAAQ
jgi:hypothetical protein